MNAHALAAMPATSPAVTPPLAVLAGRAGATPLTRVSLTHVEQRIDLYLRFGEPTRTIRLDRWRRLVMFSPGERKIVV